MAEGPGMAASDICRLDQDKGPEIAATRLENGPTAPIGLRKSGAGFARVNGGHRVTAFRALRALEDATALRSLRQARPGQPATDGGLATGVACDRRAAKRFQWC